MFSKKSESGQVLLIIILISAVLLTVGLSVSKTGIDETKITKLEEENKRALSAAEAGLESALQYNVGEKIQISDLLPQSGITGTAEVQSTSQSNFLSPIVKKNAQFTFYLSTYTNGSFSNYFNGALNIYYQGDPTTELPKPALEITLIKSDNSLTRFVFDNEDRIANAESSNSGSYTLSGYGDTFHNQIQLFPGQIGQTKLMIIRSLYADTKIGVQKGVNAPDLPAQGKTVVSTATTTTGVSKKIELFQSFPQIPADFFVTSF